MVFTVPTTQVLAKGDGLHTVSLHEFAQQLLRNGFTQWVHPPSQDYVTRLMQPGLTGEEFRNSLRDLINVLSDVVPPHRQNCMAEIQRVSDRLSTGTHTCPICYDENVILGRTGTLLTCCTGVVCNVCLERCRACPFCRTLLNAKIQLAISDMSDMSDMSDQQPVPTLADLSTRTCRMQPVLDTLTAIIRALRESNQGRRILIFTRCVQNSLDPVQCELIKMGIHTASLTNRVKADHETICRYLDRADDRPMALLCQNDPGSVTGLDLGCTDAVIVAGPLCNPRQLIARVMRPQNGGARGEIPLVMMH